MIDRLRPVMRYLVVGGICFLVDLGLLALLHQVLGVPLWIASGAAFLLAFFATFTLQRIAGIGSDVPPGPALLRYAALVAVNTVVTIAIVSLFDETHQGYVNGKFVATALTVMWNYFLYRHWVFKDVVAEPVLPSGGAVAGLTVVVPAHNSEATLEAAVDGFTRAVAERLPGEVLIVENGSTDRTWPLAEELAGRAWPVPVRAVRSERGLGSAYARGIAEAAHDHVLLTADDMPFGDSDVRGWWEHPVEGLVTIGSKGHPDSTVVRSWMRSISTRTFTMIRQVVLGMPYRDTQGTVFAPRDWARSMVPLIEDRGFLFSTELLYAAYLHGVPVREVPVTLDERSELVSRGSTVRLGDVWRMFTGLWRIRARTRTLSPIR